MTEVYSIYFLFLGKELVYIGITKNITKRLVGHRNKNYDNLRIIDNVGDKKTAAKYELRLIKYFKPILNSNIEANKVSCTFTIRPELKAALQKEADKKQWTLSYYIEQVCEDYATRNKLKVQKFTLVKHR